MQGHSSEFKPKSTDRLFVAVVNQAILDLLEDGEEADEAERWLLGIDPKLLSDGGREGHFGLRGMRERAKLIGGKLTVWSDLDAGTEVELSIPAARAYTAPTDGKRMRIADKVLSKLSGRGAVKKS